MLTSVKRCGEIVFNCLITLSFLCLPSVAFPQLTISGKVLSGADRKPLAKATVFLDNASVGTLTLDDGTYKIVNVRPGQYDLVVSSVGFETYHQSVLVNDNVSLKDIYLLQKTTMLAEVKIKPNDNWQRDFATFKRLFLGITDNAQYCKILNPDVLDLEFDPLTKVFTAKSNDFIEIQNEALGYQIKYLLSELTFDTKTGISYYEGTSSFKELDGSVSQKRKWAKSRSKAFLGSSMHFLRLAISNTLDDNGFQVMKAVRKPNPAYRGGFGSKYLLMLYPAPLPEASFISRTNKTGIFAMGFKELLYVMYKKRKSNVTDTLKSKVIDPFSYMNDPLVTIINFDQPYAFFDSNGIIINPRSVIFEGEWGKMLIADLLPVDYVPSGTAPGH